MGLNLKVLIAEDEKPIANALKKNFNAEGYSTTIVYDGEHAIKEAIVNKFDIIILDWRMPKKSGFEVCSHLRSEGINTPIILLTALTDIKNKVEALNSGADDYLTKPFSFEELIARINAVLRRYNNPSTALNFGNYSLNFTDRTLTGPNLIIKLSEREFDLLRYLIMNKGIILSKDTICLKVWGTKFDKITNIVEVTIKNLRKKIEAKTDKKFIKSVYGEGYLFTDD
jgi:DNA-binding response OmpR family regulator